MGHPDRATPIDDIAYLARSDHRGPTLIALTVRPRSRSELWEIDRGFEVDDQTKVKRI